MPPVISAPFPPGGAPIGLSYLPHQYYAPPPVLLGPSGSFSQFPAPPPAYQPRFFNHTAAGFRPMMRPSMPRSNLIVIQPMPRPEDQPRSSPSTYSGKLMLPQDRYARRVNDNESGGEKRKREFQFSFSIFERLANFYF